MYYIYILTNKYNKVLYTGVTNNLLRRAAEHANKDKRGFTNQYNADKLVYYECFEFMNDAIAREKSIKKKKRENKIALIESVNPEWKNLLEE